MPVGSCRRQRLSLWRCLQAGVPGAGWFRTQRTLRAHRGRPCRLRWTYRWAVRWRGGPRPHSANDVLQVADAASEAIDPGHKQRVALAEEVQYGLKLAAAFGGCRRLLLAADDIGACGLQGAELDIEVLVRGDRR